ncbi:PQQ-binding-like beta-propeller repeat protein [Kitasatospora sp. NPDC001527]|uniref:outer membrane protein assembly factor BamB family protein n=1 Tax=Kitasatospora sp. NPDC001527 TaxID=3154519 RepID=UPI003319B2BF
MAQDPLGDGHAQQWYPQQTPQDRPDGYHGQTGPDGYNGYHGYAEQPGAWPGELGQDVPYLPYDPYHPYGQAPQQPDAYVPDAYAYGHDGQAQQYTPYIVVPQQPTGEELYVPAGAEYTTDGYVHLEPEPDPEPSPAAEPEPVPAAAPAPSRRAGRAGRAGRRGFAAKARAAADTVVTAEHTPGRRTLLVRAGAGLAALGVLVAAGLMVSAQGDGSATDGNAAGAEPGFSAAHTRTWAARAADGASGGDDTLVGSWLLDGSVVRADATGVRAYDLADGRPVWAVDPPAAGAVPCGLSPTVNRAGLGAVLFRPQADPKSPCSLVAAVDTKDGRTAWTKPLTDTKGAYGAHVGVTDDKVIAVGDSHVVAWQSADGADVWQYTGQGRFCSLSGGVSGTTVLVASTCADSTPVDQAVALNTADGTVSWWRGLNNRPKTATVLSAEPPVVLTTGEKPEDDRVFAWGPDGDPAAGIPVAGAEGRLDVAHGSFSATPGVYFHDRTMVTTVSTAASADGTAGPVAVVGYDLDTGKQRWRTTAREKGAARAVGVDGGALVLAVDERVDQPAHLSRFALDGGQEAVGGNFPPGTGSLLVSGRVLIGGGLVVAVPEHSTNFGTATGFRAKD